MKLRKVTAASAAVLALAVGATACGSSNNDSSSSSGGGKKIKIGIKYDQPGIGLKEPNGSFSGFDVDVATYVAGKLGYKPKNPVDPASLSAEALEEVETFLAAIDANDDVQNVYVGLAG